MTEDFERNKDGSIMTKETLSDKITTIARLDWIRDKDAKEKIQNAQRRILEIINMEWSKGMQHILDETKDVFKEEFGKNFALIDNSVSEEKK